MGLSFVGLKLKLRMIQTLRSLYLKLLPYRPTNGDTVVLLRFTKENRSLIEFYCFLGGQEGVCLLFVLFNQL